MKHRKRWQRALYLLIALLLFPMTVTAQDGAGVVIMKLETVDADPDVVTALQESLRTGIEAHPDMHVKAGGQMTIKDLALTAGCSEPNAECMSTLKDFIDGDRVVFGNVEGAGDVHLFSLKMFDFAEDRFVAEVQDETISGDAARVAQVVPAVVEGLLYGNVGTLEVALEGADSADLAFDGEPVGLAPTTLENLPLGEHVVTVSTSDGQQKKEMVVLRRGEPVSVSFSLEATAIDTGGEPKAKSGRSPVPGIVSIGLGVIGLGVGAFSSLQVSEANSDIERLGDEGFVDPSTGAFVTQEAVAEAKAQNLDPEAINNRGRTFQTVQWIGYSVGAVGVGVGLFLLIRSIGSSEKNTTAALPLRFGASPTPGGFAATLRAEF